MWIYWRHSHSPAAYQKENPNLKGSNSTWKCATPKLKAFSRVDCCASAALRGGVEVCAWRWAGARLHVTAQHLLKQCLSSAGRWLCDSSLPPTSQRKSEKIHPPSIVKSNSSPTLTHIWMQHQLNSSGIWIHMHSTVKTSLQLCTRLSFSSQVLSPKCHRLRTQLWHLIPCRSLSQCCKEVFRAMHIFEVVALGILHHNSVHEWGKRTGQSFQFILTKMELY